MRIGLGIEEGPIVIEENKSDDAPAEAEACPVCYEDFEYGKTYTVADCGHKCCISCFKSNATSSLGENKMPIKCVMLNCGKEIPINKTTEQALGPVIMIKYMVRLALAANPSFI